MLVGRKKAHSTAVVLSLLAVAVFGGGALAIAVTDRWSEISVPKNRTDSPQTNHQPKQVETPQSTDSPAQSAPQASVAKPLVWQFAPAGQRFHSQAVLIYDLTRGQKIFATNEQTVRAPASLVKIMTALVAIEQLPDLQARTTMPVSVLNQMRQSNASMAGFLAGESVTVNDLLHGALLASGGDASYLLAELVGGQAEFVALMNRKAQQLGMTQTRFVNTTGLDQPGQVSTATDIAKLLQFALRHPTFRQIFEKREYLYQNTNRQLLIGSTLFKHLPQAKVNNLTVIGGKTGTTNQAGLCLASLVRQGDRELLVVTLGAPITAWPNPAPLHVADLQLILANLRLIEQ